jgi:hypothetical protein
MACDLPELVGKLGRLRRNQGRGLRARVLLIIIFYSVLVCSGLVCTRCFFVASNALLLGCSNALLLFLRNALFFFFSL